MFTSSLATTLQRSPIQSSPYPSLLLSAFSFVVFPRSFKTGLHFPSYSNFAASLYRSSLSWSSSPFAFLRLLSNRESPSFAVSPYTLRVVSGRLASVSASLSLGFDGLDSRQGRDPTRPATLDLRRQATGRRPYLVRLQHPKGIDASSRPASSRWHADLCQDVDWQDDYA